MGEYDLILNPSSIIPWITEIENKDLLFISYERNIPNPSFSIKLSFSFDENGHILINDGKNDPKPDPSTIYFHLPITEDFKVDPMSYFPNYVDLSSGQRYRYLNWLRNIDNQIDIGYVFLYYYGLERHLLIGNYEKAFDQIIRLRRNHKNKSFLKYSEAALINGAIMRNRLSDLLTLHEKTEISGFSNVQFFVAYKKGLPLGAENLINVFYKAFPSSRKVINEDRFNFTECLKTILLERTNGTSIEIKGFDLSKTKTKSENRFANYSFPWDIRKVEVTDFYQCKELMNEIQSLFDLTRTLYKSKNTTKKRTAEDIILIQKKKCNNRYKSLYKSKKITQDEFELLQKHLEQKFVIKEKLKKLQPE